MLDFVGTRDQIRRILLLGTTSSGRSTPGPQLDLPLGPPPREEAGDTFLDESSDLAHALLLELTVLIQMEVTGLVASPLLAQGRKRLGLGSDPPLRLLAEWESAPPLDHDPWQIGTTSPGREEAFQEGLGRVRTLVNRAEIAPARVREMARRTYALAARCGPEDDLPGQILVHAGRNRLRRTPAGRLSFHGDQSLGRGTGVVHTPALLASELVEVLCGARTEGEDPAALDPACGSGLFLLALAQHLLGRPASRKEGPDACGRRLARLQNIYGVDLDPRACRIAGWNLSYWAAREAQAALPEGRELGPFLDGLFGPSFPYFLARQVQTGNALLLEPSTFSPGFNWEARYPAIFQRRDPGFDIVLGNPPWISFGLRNRAGAPEEERLYYERLYPAGTQYKLTIYPLFMELALRLCRPGGLHGFLVPDSLLTGHHFSRIRRHLLSEADLLELTLIESGLWAGVSAGQTVLYAVRKKESGRTAAGPVKVRNRFLKINRGRGRTAWSSMSEERKPFSESTQVWVPSIQYSPAGAAPLHVYRDEGQVEFLTQIQNSPLRVKDVVWTYSGLIARYGQKSIQAASPEPRFVLHDGRGQEVYSDGFAGGRWQPALLSGGEIQPFVVRYNGGLVYLPDTREELARVYKSGFDLERYKAPKIFLRQTGDRLIAALDQRGFYCLNNLHLIGGREGVAIPPLLLAGILMSGPLQRAYRLVSQEGSRPLAQVDLKTLEELPYPSDASGLPVGAGPIPPRSQTQARRILRVLERNLMAEDPAPVLELCAEAWQRGPRAFAAGPLKGRDVLTLILLRLLELRTEECAAAARGARNGARGGPAEPGTTQSKRPPRAARASVLQWVLDEICAVLFQVSSS